MTFYSLELKFPTLYSGSWLIPGQDSSVGVPSSLAVVKEDLLSIGVKYMYFSIGKTRKGKTLLYIPQKKISCKEQWTLGILSLKDTWIFVWVDLPHHYQEIRVVQHLSFLVKRKFRKIKMKPWLASSLIQKL